MEKLVIDNLGLAYHITRKYRRAAVEYEDIVGTAMLGLVKAAKKYDPDRGIKFGAYAGMVIDNEILQLLRRERRHHKEVCSLQDETVEGCTMADIIPDPRRFEDVVEIRLRIRRLMGSLDERERTVLRMSVLYGKNQTDIGQAIGVSQTIVCRILKNIHVKGAM